MPTHTFQLCIQDFVSVSNTYFDAHGKGKHVSFSILITARKKMDGSYHKCVPCASKSPG